MRRVQVTERNPISSRSHAVCELRISRGQNLHPCGRGAVSGDSTSLPRMDLLSLDATNAAEEQVVENCAGQPGSVVSGNSHAYFNPQLELQCGRVSVHGCLGIITILIEDDSCEYESCAALEISLFFGQLRDCLRRFLL